MSNRSWLSIKTVSRHALILSVLLTSVGTFAGGANAPSCSAIFANTSAGIHRYALGVKDLNGFIQIGFESEYRITDKGIPALLRDYAPLEHFTSHQWLELTDQARIHWVNTNLLQAKNVKSGLCGLKLINLDPRFSFLPEELVLDATGSLEIVLTPSDSYEEWKFKKDLINARFGAGSMQAMNSTPREVLFAQGTDSLKGYLNFTHDADTISKLAASVGRYNPSEPTGVAKSFLHPFLGPMTVLKQSAEQRYIESNARGLMYDKESLAFVPGMAESFKYIGGTAYRPDIASPNRASFEVRDAHQNSTLIESRVARLMKYLMHPAPDIARYSDVPAVHQERDFEKFPADVQHLLRTVVPAYSHGSYVYQGNERTAIELYRNFAFPMRDWSIPLTDLNERSALPRVLRAQQAYVSRLHTIGMALNKSEITNDLGSKQVQNALVTFVGESGLAPIYKAHEQAFFGGAL